MPGGGTQRPSKSPRARSDGWILRRREALFDCYMKNEPGFRAGPRNMNEAFETATLFSVLLDPNTSTPLGGMIKTIPGILFEKGDRVRLFQPNGYARKRWSNDIYEIHKVYLEKKF